MDRYRFHCGRLTKRLQRTCFPPGSLLHQPKVFGLSTLL